MLAELEVPPAKLPSDMQAALQVPIPVPEPGPLSTSALAALYTQKKGTGAAAVPGHRFGIADLTAAAQQGADPIGTLSTIESWTSLGLDWAAALSALADLDGNVSYEQLCCVGLDIAQSRLVGTVKIKLPTGYSGDLCTVGSTEYVSFWGDFGNADCSLTYLGTASVPVHDIASIPPDGLTYAVVLPVDLSAFEASCETPLIGRVRAGAVVERPAIDHRPEHGPVLGQPPRCSRAGTRRRTRGGHWPERLRDWRHRRGQH